MECRFCKAELKVGENWYLSHAQKSDFVCKDCRRITSRESMRRFHERRTGIPTPRPKLTEDEKRARMRAYQAAFRERHRERLNAERRADTALLRKIKAMMKDQTPPTNPGE